MATTSIWRVKGQLGKVVSYAKNIDKTANPEYKAKRTEAAEREQWLNDVINYATQKKKTDIEVHDEGAEIKRSFVSGVNCQPDTARDEMTAIKMKYGKPDGVIAYHGYQSFAPGEATPEIAHEIGLKLAERLWGERYQVVVATHLDKGNHLHNHFVLNNVSMIDGRKYYRSEKDYYDMRRESDALCRAYGLSVIEDPKPGKSKHYGEWNADKEGKPTYRSTVKADVDAAIRQSMTERQFFEALKKMGYHIKSGQDITVRPEGKDRGLKLKRNFGDDYSIESIRRRILAQARPERRIIPPDLPPKKMHIKGSVHKVRKATGLRALYFYYLYRMGVLPKKREPNPKQVYFLFREDIRFIQRISEETRLLVKHGIDTDVQLAAYKGGVQSQMNALYENRKRLRYRVRSIRDDNTLASVKADIAELSEQIGELRREVRLCEEIETRSGVMRDKLRSASEDEKSKKKEVRVHEPSRRRR